ncbi:hypothetical protein QBC43DRAFT_38676 [Cladorrhinum sp. PSN259]|nr:hypothetical protein QBC43DRAFT_38676 [Cladorrhinum sp. PSN259]
MKQESSVNIAVSEKIDLWNDQELTRSPSPLVCQRTKETCANSLLQAISALNPAAYFATARGMIKEPDRCPLRFMSSTARKAREARRRSEAIDLQIVEDRRRMRSQLLLFTGGFSNHDEGKWLILDSMARWSNPRANNSLPSDPKPSGSQAAFVRKTVLNVVQGILSNVVGHALSMNSAEISSQPMLLRADRIQEMIHNGEGSFQEIHATIEELWGTDTWRSTCYKRVGRSKAFDDKILDIFHRAAAIDYLPSYADIRFAKCCLRSFNGDTYEVTLRMFVEAVDLNNVWRRPPMTSNKPTKALGDRHSPDATCILCPIDLASYTYRCPDSGQNNLACTIERVQQLSSSKAFPYAATIILFWNAKSFRNKIKTWPLENYFPDYKPTMNDTRDPAVAALQFIIDKTLSSNKTTEVSHRLKQLYVRVGEPDDPTTVNFITICLKQSLLDKCLIDSGIL